MQALRLPRFHTRYPVCSENGSPRGDSIRTTSAPLSARNIVVIGPAMPQDRSRTRRCSNARAIRLHPFTFWWVDHSTYYVEGVRCLPVACPGGSARPVRVIGDRRGDHPTLKGAGPLGSISNAVARSPPGGSHLTATREYRRIGDHRMSNQFLPPRSGGLPCQRRKIFFRTEGFFPRRATRQPALA